MQALSDSISNVALIERQIVPLMTRMVDALENFVQLDTPFLMKERTERVARLREMMERSDVTAAEKFRRVIEGYQIENDYGRTIEAYKGTTEINGNQLEVDFCVLAASRCCTSQLAQYTPVPGIQTLAHLVSYHLPSTRHRFQTGLRLHVNRLHRTYSSYRLPHQRGQCNDQRTKKNRPCQRPVTGFHHVRPGCNSSFS